MSTFQSSYRSGGTGALRRHQRGVAALEFALVFLFGFLPLIMLTVSGVLIYAAKESLTLAAEEGARASLQYASTPALQEAAACNAAQQAMPWLLSLAGYTPGSFSCTSTSSPIAVTPPTTNCPVNNGNNCMQVTTSINYNQLPLFGAQAIFGWALNNGTQQIKSTATVQLDPGS